ncbi:MAG: DUF3037 domain-containing protein [Leptolyngbya sp. RL_3_1]|nr:DUF3037 domain-containing protein [Leptolyngbya sp. RL_3_1]
MVSRYSVIQYVPNPITDERINVGVLAFDDETVQVHFLSSWERVRCFGQREDIAILKEFAQQMEEVAGSGLLFPGDQSGPTPKHERLLAVADGWRNSVQFTAPRGSLESVDDLLETMVQTYLLETNQRPKPRDRQFAARLATTHVRNLLKQQFGKDAVKELLRTNYELSGHHKNHKFDVTVANGKPFFAAHGISFEVQTSEAVMDSLAWMIVDVKESMPELPLAVVALPPRPDVSDHRRLMKLYDSTTETYQDLGAKVLDETGMDTWVSQQIEQMNFIPPHGSDE